MLKKDFCELMGLADIKDEDYRAIESVYNETDDNKEAFCEAWKSKDGVTLRQYCLRLASKLNAERQKSWKAEAYLESVARHLLTGDEYSAKKDICDYYGRDKAIQLKIDEYRDLKKKHQYDHPDLEDVLDGNDLEYICNLLDKNN